MDAEPKQPVALMLADDGEVPNNTALPALVYKGEALPKLWRR